METFTGKKFWPLDPKAEEIRIEDIAHALSMLCRFGGHCREFYSVAQHSCLVTDLVVAVEPRHALAALLHDAAEAYTGDVIRPIKRSEPKIGAAEEAVMQEVARRFDLMFPFPDVVKWADNVMLKNEHRQLMAGVNEWPSCDQEEGPQVEIVPWTPTYAESVFLRKFEELHR